MKGRLTLLALLFAGFAPAQEEKEREPFDRYHRTIFFAVLEGAFEDGIADEDVDLILAVDPETKRYRNFVYSCPICMPAIDALKTYRNRGMWPYKSVLNAFGLGLDPVLRAGLRADRDTRQRAVQSLLERWIERRLDLVRATDGERADYARAFAEMRKQGMEALRADRGAMDGAPRCAACDGANDPFTR